MSDWLRQDFVKRRIRAEQYLGGKCVDCGAVENLEFDHIDAKTKSFGITQNINRRWEVLVFELDKCALRCNSCHRKKSKLNGESGGRNKLPIVHGTANTYTVYKCRCIDCKWAKSLQRNGLITNSEIVAYPRSSVD